MQLRFGYWGEAASERDNFRSLTGELGRSSERAIWGLGRSSERAICYRGLIFCLVSTVGDSLALTSAS
ncbi:unnamed protein product [Rhodiola kirilowii]